MKNHWLKIHLLLSSLFIFSNSQSQTYLNSTAVWEQVYSYNYFGQTSNHCEIRRYFNGDSVVNTFTYLKLYSHEVCTLVQTQFDSLGNAYYDTTQTDTDVLRGLLRETDRTIWFMNPMGNEFLLYDFRAPDFASVDSMVPQPGCSPFSPPYLVPHDTVCIGPIGRKRWGVSMSTYPLASAIVEGVGPTSGFLAPVCRNGCPECSYSLTRFTMNGDTLYQGTCSIATAAPAPAAPSSLQLMPNPVNDRLHLSGLPAAAELSIFDALGRQVFAAPVQGPELELDCSQWTGGLYFLRMESPASQPTGTRFLISR